jgi:hypothetical protein
MGDKSIVSALEIKKRGRPPFIWKIVFYPKKLETMLYDIDAFVEFGTPEKLVLSLLDSERSMWYGSEKIVLSRCEHSELAEIKKIEEQIMSVIKNAVENKKERK